MTKSLEEFVGSEKKTKRTVCWVCNIPECQEIEEGFEKGIPVNTIVRWLKNECDYGTEATDDKVRNHKKNHWIPDPTKTYRNIIEKEDIPPDPILQWEDDGGATN